MIAATVGMRFSFQVTGEVFQRSGHIEIVGEVVSLSPFSPVFVTVRACFQFVFVLRYKRRGGTVARPEITLCEAKNKRR